VDLLNFLYCDVYGLGRFMICLIGFACLEALLFSLLAAGNGWGRGGIGKARGSSFEAFGSVENFDGGAVGFSSGSAGLNQLNCMWRNRVVQFGRLNKKLGVCSCPNPNLWRRLWSGDGFARVHRWGLSPDSGGGFTSSGGFLPLAVWISLVSRAGQGEECFFTLHPFFFRSFLVIAFIASVSSVLLSHPPIRASKDHL
jgi:hypothetical protein